MSDYKQVQTRLAAAGLYSGDIDGKRGPRSVAAEMCAAAGLHTPTAVMSSLAIPFAALPQTVGIDRPLRICHFLAQVCCETDHFRTLVEYGDEEYFTRYDGRADLGNDETGDGYRFRGRGPLQLTGRANYATMTAALGVDLIANPDLAADPSAGTRAACTFWDAHNINPWADADVLSKVTRLVNGGGNGIDLRRRALANIKSYWGI